MTQNIETIREWTRKGHRCEITLPTADKYCGYIATVSTGLRFYIGADDWESKDELFGDLPNGTPRIQPQSNGWIGYKYDASNHACVDENGELVHDAMYDPDHWKSVVITVEKVEDDLNALCDRIDALELFVESQQ